MTIQHTCFDQQKIPKLLVDIQTVPFDESYVLWHKIGVVSTSPGYLGSSLGILA
jgi:hypothetical protein